MPDHLDHTQAGTNNENQRMTGPPLKQQDSSDLCGSSNDKDMVAAKCGPATEAHATLPAKVCVAH